MALAHGQEADDWKGPLMDSLATTLAKEGVCACPPFGLDKHLHAGGKVAIDADESICNLIVRCGAW